MASQTRLRSPLPRCAVGDQVPSFERDSEAAAVENAQRGAKGGEGRGEGKLPIVRPAEAPARNGRFLDAVTIWALEHLVGWHCLHDHAASIMPVVRENLP